MSELSDLTERYPNQEERANPVSDTGSIWLAHMTDEQIREGIAAIPEEKIQQMIERSLPGITVEKNPSLGQALTEAGAAFIVEKHPLLRVGHVDGLVDEYVSVTPITSHKATVRTDTMAQLGIVGSDYGIVQTPEALASLDVMQSNGNLEIRKVEVIDGGARIRVSALLGVSTFESAGGAPNTLAHMGIFEATHDMSACTSATLYTVRLECFNGMTSRKVVKSHKLRHTSKAADRVNGFTRKVVETMIGEAEAEVAIFRSLVNRPMNASEFDNFISELLGGELEEDAGKSRVTRRENAVKELTEYFEGGNQGAGPTLWGGYQSLTRWVEAKRERIEDAAAAQRKFTSNLAGDGQSKVAKGLAILRRLAAS